MKRHEINYNSWPVHWLSNYIEKLQRKTISEKSKIVLQNISLVKSTNCNLNNAILQLHELFTEWINQLSAHMMKEEQYLFPFIRDMAEARELNRCVNRTALDQIEWLIEILKEEHAVETKRLKLSTELNLKYFARSNTACSIQSVIKELAEFEQNCNLHIHLQTAYLFPRIISAKYSVI